MTSEADPSSATRRLKLVHEPPAGVHAALADGDRALYAEGDLRASRESFERAYQLAERAADAQAMAAAALGLAGLWVSEHRTVTGTVMLQARLDQCLAVLDPGSSLALRIRVRLAGESDYIRGGSEAILAALAEARAAADSVALAEALSLAHHCLLGPDGVAIRRRLAVELIRASFSTDRRSDRLMGLLWQTIDAFLEGDPHAGRLLGELRELLSQRAHPAVGFVVSAVDVMLAIRAGNLTAAESLIQVCAESGVRAGDIDSEWWPGAQLVTIRWYQGRLPELLPMLTERVHSPALSAVDDSAVAALAVAAALSGDDRTAVSCLARLRGGGLTGLPRSSSWLVTMNGIAEAASLVGDAALAAAVHELLLPHASLPMIGGLGATCFGSTQHALGVASLTTGQLDRAVEHFRVAIQLNLALPHWPAVVSSRLRLAEALTLRGQPGDLEAAGLERRTAGREAAATGLRDPAGKIAAAAGAAGAECSRAGRSWRIGWQDRSALIPDSIGMLHLAVLIANPRRDIPATDLVAGLSALTASAEPAPGQPVLDHQAIAEYRQRRIRLDGEIAELEAAGAQPEAARARAERDWLATQLASAAGLSGRTRSFPDDAERARVAVSKAIRRALTRIAAADPVIGAHLEQTVRTGTRCSYWPA
jgi:tetratricopeptide (TPR) repeat protein